MRINKNKLYFVKISFSAVLPVYYHAITFLQVEWSTTKSHQNSLGPFLS